MPQTVRCFTSCTDCFVSASTCCWACPGRAWGICKADECLTTASITAGAMGAVSRFLPAQYSLQHCWPAEQQRGHQCSPCSTVDTAFQVRQIHWQNACGICKSGLFALRMWIIMECPSGHSEKVDSPQRQRRRQCTRRQRCRGCCSSNQPSPARQIPAAIRPPLTALGLHPQAGGEGCGGQGCSTGRRTAARAAAGRREVGQPLLRRGARAGAAGRRGRQAPHRQCPEVRSMSRIFTTPRLWMHIQLLCWR